MATKSPNTHGKIPTVSELLENPSIRGLADRWNRSVVMSGVRSFLDEVRNDLARRGEAAEWPSLRELAEKAARHVVASQQPSQRAAINATGRVWGGPWVGRPQSDMALQHAFAAGREFVAGADAASASPAAGDVESLLCRVTGARAAVAVHSYSGGLWLALTAVAAGREVLVARGEMGEAESSCPIADVIDAAGATLCEVGATNRASTADYEAAATPHTAALLKLSPERYCVVGETESAELDALVGLARDRELVLIDALGNAPLIERSTQFSWPGRSLQASLTAGADLAIVRGDGMAGGPTCGILAGDRTLIERIVAHPLFAAWQLDPPRAAALAATLHSDDDRSHAESRTPLSELLNTPLDNLRNRAERLAPQLALADGIGSAEAVAMISHCDGVRMPERGLPSYGVTLAAEDGDAAGLGRRFAAASMPVFGRIEGDRWMLDLRTVLPRHDQAIVRALQDDRSEVTSETAPVGGASPR